MIEIMNKKVINIPSPKGIDPKLNKLLDVILKKRLQPEDQYEIAAILESNGWNDARAADEYGVDTVFDLAADLWDILKNKVSFEPFSPGEKLSRAEYLLMVLKSYLRGMIFALPMAISVMSMLILRFSLWSYENLSLEMATSIAIGTILSFMAIGGFTQAIARRGFLYIKQGYYNMARRITFYFVRIGYLFCFVIALVFLLFNAFFGVFPFRMTIVIVLYFFFLSAIWLSVTIMYILEKELTFTALLVIGISIVFILFELLNLNIILAQIIALVIVAVAGISLAMFYFISAEKKMERGIAPALPRASITIYTVLPYFSYGFLYFTFLFVDRIIAWSTSGSYMPYLIWFRGPYELGLDLALLTLIFPMGFIEVVVNEIMINLEASQKDFYCYEGHLFSRRYLGIYWKRILIVFMFSVFCAVLIYLAVRFIRFAPFMAINGDLLANSTTHFVFILALLAYSILSVALMNVLILFSISQPEMVDRSILMAFLLNIVIGFPLSRWIDHSFAVVGLLLGAIVLFVMTSRYVLRVLSKLDYYLYATS